VIGEIGSGGSFRGLGHYLLHGSAGTHPKTPEWVELRNLASVDPDRAYLELEATASQNPRVRKPVLHVVLSPAPGDELGREQWRELADRVLGELGLSEHQALVVLHTDTGHPHLHLAVNRVHPRTLRAWGTWRSKTRLEGVLRKVEREWGLRVVPGRLAGAERSVEAAAPALTRGERAQLHHRAEEPQVLVWRRELREAFEGARSWTELAGRLQVNGVHLVARGRGMVLSDGEVYVKLSRLDRAWSRGRLEERFGQGFAEWRREMKQFQAAAEIYPRYAARGPEHPRARASLRALRRTGESLGWRSLYRLAGPLSPAVAGVALAARRRKVALERVDRRDAVEWEGFARGYLAPALGRARSWAEAESRLALYGAWLAPAGDRSSGLVVTDGPHTLPVGRLGAASGVERLEERFGFWETWQRARRKLLAAARRVEGSPSRFEREGRRWRRLVGLIRASERRIEGYEVLHEEYRRAERRLRERLSQGRRGGRRRSAEVQATLRAIRSASPGQVESVLASAGRPRGWRLGGRSRPEKDLVELAGRYRDLAGRLARAAPPARSAGRRLDRLRRQARLTNPHRLREERRHLLVEAARPLLASGVRSLVARAAPGVGPALKVLRILRRLQRDRSRGEDRSRE
jgi:hypothetical protein